MLLRFLGCAVTGAFWSGAAGGALACEAPLALHDTSSTQASVGLGTPASCTEEALRRAVAQHAVVTFDCGAAPITIAISRSIDIAADRNTVIDGAHRVTLDGRNGARILSLVTAGYRSNSNGLTLQRIRLVNGKAPGLGFVAPDAARPQCAAGFAGGSGGAIEVGNALLRVIDVTFESNAAASPGPDVGGGAIYAAGSLGVTIVASRFVGNSASNGGAVGLLQSNVSISNSRFEANSATGTGANYAGADVAGCPGVGHPGQGGSGGNGGAVVVDGSDDGDLVVCGSTFSGNSANELAGALFRTANGPPRRTVLERSVFVGNQARQGGAAFIMNASPLEITASNFTDNVAEAAGAAQFANSRLVLTDSIFAGNQATRSVGGALMLSGSHAQSSIRDVTFARNTASIVSGRFGDSIFGPTDFSIENTVQCDTRSSTLGAAGATQPVTPMRSGQCRLVPIESTEPVQKER